MLETLSRSRDVLRVSISCIVNILSISCICCSGSDSSSEASLLGIEFLNQLCWCSTYLISSVSTLLFFLLFPILVDRVIESLHG